MIKKISLLILLSSSLQSTVFANEDVCIKTGRQYYIELANYLGSTEYMSRYKRKFTELANNLPKKGFKSEFAPSLSSLVQLSDVICTRYSNQLFPQKIRTDGFFKKDDGHLITKTIGDEIFENEVSFPAFVDEDIERYLLNRGSLMLANNNIFTVCQYYISNARSSGGILKNTNLNEESYCDSKSEEIAKTLKARNEAEAEAQMKKNSTPQGFQYTKIINDTYKKILKRFPTQKEMDLFKTMNLESDNNASYAACLTAAASFEFIQNGKCK
jgi:hypothetical protein